MVETFLNPDDPSDAQYRLRLVDGEPFPTSMRVQCTGTTDHEVPLGSNYTIDLDEIANFALKYLGIERLELNLEFGRSHTVPRTKDRGLSNKPLFFCNFFNFLCIDIRRHEFVYIFFSPESVKRLHLQSSNQTASSYK